MKLEEVNAINKELEKIGTISIISPHPPTSNVCFVLDSVNVDQELTEEEVVNLISRLNSQKKFTSREALDELLLICLKRISKEWEIENGFFKNKENKIPFVIQDISASSKVQDEQNLQHAEGCYFLAKFNKDREQVTFSLKTKELAENADED